MGIVFLALIVCMMQMFAGVFLIVMALNCFLGGAWLAAALLTVAGVVVILPARFDPLVRLRMRMEEVKK